MMSSERCWSLLWTALRVGALSYAGLCLYLFLRQSHYVYFPTRDLLATPADVGLDFEDLELRTTDGETIHAWYVPAGPGAVTLLDCHGNGGNIGDRVATIRLFHDLGLSVLIFDYRGYGRSSGKPGEAGTYRDAEAAWRHLTERRGVPAGEIVVFGRSLGGAVATWLAAEHTPAALIVESAFSSLPDMAQESYPYLPARLFCRFRYDNAARIRQVRCPVLVAHSPEDEMIPFDQGRAVFNAARSPKEFFPLEGDHNGGFLAKGEAYAAGLRTFLTTYVPAYAATRVGTEKP
jgi:fermentation-respiration switch protein FrsA (DUF1100 family)